MAQVVSSVPLPAGEEGESKERVYLTKTLPQRAADLSSGKELTSALAFAAPGPICSARMLGRPGASALPISKRFAGPVSGGHSGG